MGNWQERELKIIIYSSYSSPSLLLSLYIFLINQTVFLYLKKQVIIITNQATYIVLISIVILRKFSSLFFVSGNLTIFTPRVFINLIFYDFR